MHQRFLGDSTNFIKIPSSVLLSSKTGEVAHVVIRGKAKSYLVGDNYLIKSEFGDGKPNFLSIYCNSQNKLIIEFHDHEYQYKDCPEINSIKYFTNY